MAKIPFDIKYRPQIESGEYQLETTIGEPAQIVKWDCRGKYPLLVIIDDGDTDDVAFFHLDGVGCTEEERLWIVTDEPEMTVEDLKKAVESGGALPLWLESALCKRYLEGYSKGQEEAEKRHREATSFHFSTWPPCFSGGPCTNPYHDCINCPRPGTSGIAKTDTNIK